MIRAAIAFFAFAILAYVLGANNIAGTSVEVGQTLLFVFLILAVISVLASLLTGRRQKQIP